MAIDCDALLLNPHPHNARPLHTTHPHNNEQQKNHLSGLKRRLLKLSFWNVQQLMEVRRELAPVVARNRGRSGVADALTALRAEQAARQAALLRGEDGAGGGGGGGGGEGGGGGAGGRPKVRWVCGGRGQGLTAH